MLNTQKVLPPDWKAMGEAAKLFTRSLMLGLDSAVRKAEFDEPTAEDIENMPYHEAVEYLKKRDVIKKVDYDSLSDKMRFRAFTASRIADGDLLKKLNAEMIASVNDGKGLSDFLSLTKTDILDKIGMGAGSGWYYETVYRTNVQTAYNVGRAMGFAEDKPLALELVIIDDSRTSDICRQYAGKRFILPYDHPFWQTHWPPFHFNCRTTIRAIYDESELPENWSNPKDIEDANNGFGAYPLAGDGWWEELSSQVARAKEYGVQGEILGAKEILINHVGEKQTKKDLQDISDFSDLKAYFNERYGTTFATDIETLGFENVKDILNGAESIIKDFPDIQLQKVLARSDGFASFVDGELALTPKYFKLTHSELLEICKKNSDSGWWVKNSSLITTGAHETAHAVEEMLINLNKNYTSENMRIIAWNECKEAKAIVSEAVKNIKKTEYGKGKLKAELINAISRYAYTTESETLAEAFADICANGNDANPLSNEIKRLTIKAYKNYKGV